MANLYSEEEDIEPREDWYDDLTPTGSLMNLQITVNHNEDENDLRTLGLDLYKFKETQVRYRLHQEYLNKYIAENIVPVGLQITKRPTVGRDNDHTRDFKKRWETKIRGYSKELMEMLTEYYLEEVEMIEQEGKTIDNKIGELWDKQEK